VDQLMVVIAIAALLAGAAIQVVLALAGYWSGQRRPGQPAPQAVSTERLEEMSDKIIALEARLQVVHAQLSQLGVRQQALDLRNTHGPEGKAYEVAANLARKGTRLDEIIKTCGISRGEAELIGRLYEADAEAHGSRDGRAAFGGGATEKPVPTVQAAPPAARKRRGGNINQVVE